MRTRGGGSRQNVPRHERLTDRSTSYLFFLFSLPARDGDRVHVTNLTTLDAEFVAVGDGGEVDEDVDCADRLVDYVATVQ